MIAGIEIENFTAFGNLDIPLSPRINVIIGSNGTGKTHLLKAIYALAIASQPASAVEGSETDENAQLTNKLLRVFSPGESRIGALRARRASGGVRLCLTSSDDTRVAISFNSNSRGVQVERDARSEAQSRPVFIPTKEVLSLVRAMQYESHDRATVEMIFDDTYLDLAELLANPGFEDEAASLAEDPRLSNIVRELVALVGGRYRWTKDGGFQFEPGGYEERADPERSRAKTAQMYQDSTVLRFVPRGREPFSSGMTAEAVQPNICVLQDVRFTPSEMQDVAAVVGSDLFTADFRETMGQFEQAKNFGSLIVPRLRDPAEVARVVRLKDFGGDLLLREVQERVLKVLEMAEALSPKYHVVVAKPARHMSPKRCRQPVFSVCRM